MDQTDHSADSPSSSSPSLPFSSAVPRNALLFDPAAPEVQQQQNAVEEEDDQFYELTAEDLRKMLKALQDESKRQNSLLPTKLIKERDQQLKHKAYKHSIVRFRLNNGQILQTQFLSTEPVSALFIFLRQIISPTIRFELRQIPTTSGKLKADDSTISLLDAGIAPKSVLILKIVAVDNSPESSEQMNADQIFMADCFRICTQTEAKAEAQKWLSSNTEFRPYLDTILHMFPSSDSSTVTAAAMPSSVMPPSSAPHGSGNGGTNSQSRNNSQRTTRPSSAELPKWLKRK